MMHSYNDPNTNMEAFEALPFRPRLTRHSACAFCSFSRVKCSDTVPCPSCIRSRRPAEECLVRAETKELIQAVLFCRKLRVVYEDFDISDDENRRHWVAKFTPLPNEPIAQSHLGQDLQQPDLSSQFYYPHLANQETQHLSSPYGSFETHSHQNATQGHRHLDNNCDTSHLTDYGYGSNAHVPSGHYQSHDAQGGFSSNASYDVNGGEYPDGQQDNWENLQPFFYELAVMAHAQQQQQHAQYTQMHSPLENKPKAASSLDDALRDLSLGEGSSYGNHHRMA